MPSHMDHPQHLSFFLKADKYELVEETIQQLKLTTCADTAVGNELHRGISGGVCVLRFKVHTEYFSNSRRPAVVQVFPFRCSHSGVPTNEQKYSLSG